MQFKKFTEQINAQWKAMLKMGELFVVGTDKHALYEKYMDSYPAGTNEIHEERRSHDCNTCKNFIRDVGNVVAIVDGKMITVWDIDAEGEYAIVANTMRDYVLQHSIANIFNNHEKMAGAVYTHQQKPGQDVIRWHHFHAEVPKSYVQRTPTDLANARTSAELLHRGVTEFSDAAFDTVLELIGQNSLYKGEEFKPAVEAFYKLKQQYDALENSEAQHLFLWANYKNRAARFKNTVIGTLIEDLSDGKDLEAAVKSYEDKTAPANYKRPKALITPGMIKAATATIDELGIEQSLYRRHAVPSDVNVNNVLFADRSIKPSMKGGVAALLEPVAKPKNVNLSKVEEISIADFEANVLPKIDSMEVYFENRHKSNMVSLIAPQDADAPNILKWNNNFTWSYAGNVTDSMKAKVKAAGGKVDGVLRFSIQWNEKRNECNNDLDAHCYEPGGNEIYYSNKYNRRTEGQLDVDITRPCEQTVDGVAVENITWPDLNKMDDGTYKFFVRNFSGANVDGFRAEIEFNGEVHQFDYAQPARGDVAVAEVTLRNGEFTIKPSLESSQSSVEVWGINTNTFVPVTMMTISPNHWDGQEIGNKHHFFILDGCLNNEPARGFYNEFLDSKLDKHRKVFEILGEKTKCEVSDTQLSGLGFSSTKRNELVVKVKGSFTRMLKIKF